MAFLIGEYREELLQALSEVGEELRCAFAASCGERLVPHYRKFSDETGQGDFEVLRTGLDNIWSWLEEGRIDHREARQSADKCLKRAFPGDTFHMWAFAADHAAAATTYALRTAAEGRAHDARLAGMRVLDAVDTVLQRRLFSDRSNIVSLSAEDDQRILEHSLFQGEVSRQRNDVAELVALTEADFERVSTLRHLRARASAESATLFGSVAQ